MSKLRVAAYCRVSTDKSDQKNSFESQKAYFEQYIANRPDWELYAVYADEGVTGTSVRRRVRFMKMIEDARAGLFDMIVTKEISRFARNTLDSIYYTRELKRLGVGVFFMNDNLSTLEPDCELRLTIMSSIAQEESRRTSERVKWGQQRRMEQGVVFGRDMLGYDVRNGTMTVNEEGAAVVRRIFRMYTEEGMGAFTIARRLRESAVPSMRGGCGWTGAVVLKILKNEKYCGDLVQKKTFTPDYLTHEKRQNPDSERIIIKDHHQPIISRELFERTAAEIRRRRKNADISTRHSGRCALSGKLICGLCGSTFVPRYKTLKDGSRSRSWRCGEAARNGAVVENGSVGCAPSTVREADACRMLFYALEELGVDLEELAEKTIALLERERRAPQHTDREAARAKEKERRLKWLYINGEIDEEYYLQEKSQLVIADKQETPIDIDALRQQTVALLDVQAQNQTLLRALVERITVTPQGAQLKLTGLEEKWSFSRITTKPT